MKVYQLVLSTCEGESINTEILLLNKEKSVVKKYMKNQLIWEINNACFSMEFTDISNRIKIKEGVNVNIDNYQKVAIVTYRYKNKEKTLQWDDFIGDYCYFNYLKNTIELTIRGNKFQNGEKLFSYTIHEIDFDII